MCVRPSLLASGPFPPMPVFVRVQWMWLSGTPISLKPNCWTKWMHLFLKMCTESVPYVSVNNTMNA